LIGHCVSPQPWREIDAHTTYTLVLGCLIDRTAGSQPCDVSSSLTSVRRRRTERPTPRLAATAAASTTSGVGASKHRVTAPPPFGRCVRGPLGLPLRLLRGPCVNSA